jgi:hypothetical protein
VTDDYDDIKTASNSDSDKSDKTISDRIKNDGNIIFQRDDVYIEVSDNDLVNYEYRKLL